MKKTKSNTNYNYKKMVRKSRLLIVALWIIQGTLGLRQDDHQIFPVNVIGTPQEISPSDLSCNVLRTQPGRDILQYQVSLPFQESLTRVGYLCSSVESVTTCDAEWTQYHFKSRVNKQTISKESCAEAVTKFGHGHIGGAALNSPSCSYWSSSTIKSEKSILVTRVVLPFSPEDNGVVSEYFTNKVCQDSHCLTHDQLTHWFMDETEKIGCQNLKPGFFEIQKVVRVASVKRITSSNVFRNVPLEGLCLGPRYCGFQTLLTETWKGIVLDSSQPELIDIVQQVVRPCRQNRRIITSQPQSFVSEMDTAAYNRLALHVCESKINDIQLSPNLSDNLLSIFTPTEEGIYPGYRVENNRLYRYSLLYVYGQFVSVAGSRGGTDFSWEVRDVVGQRHLLRKSLCVNNIGSLNSAVGPICHWFNGITLQGATINYPSYTNGFHSNHIMTLGDSLPDSEAKGELDGFFTQRNIVITGSIGAALLGSVCFVLLICWRCKRSRKTNPKYTVSYPMSDYVDRSSEVSVRTVPRGPLQLSNSQRLALQLPQVSNLSVGGEDVQGDRLMLEWFG